MLPTLLLLITAAVVPSRAVIITGQSLSQGLSTGSAVSTSQTGNNQMSTNTFSNVYDLVVAPSDWPFVALNETPYGLEHPRSGLADYYRTATGLDLFTIASGRGSSLYSQILASDTWISQARTIESYGARSDGAVIASYVVHGESDQNGGTSRAAYQTVLVDWQAALQAKVRASTKTGSNAVVPMYVEQMNSWTALTALATTSPIPLAQVDTCRAHPTTHVCVGPGYGDVYAADGIHKSNTGSRAMGARAGKAIAFGATWQPTWITAATRSTTTIIVTYHVPCVDLGTCGATRLAMDTTIVTGMGSPSYGFEYTGATITAVAICTGVDAPVAGCVTSSQVAITINANAAGTLRYAYTGTSGAHAGPTTGPRGNLRDTDTSTWASAPLYNWAMTDEWVVP